MTSSIFTVIVICTIVGQAASASDFRGIAKVSVEDLEKDFLEELANSTSAVGKANSRILNLEAMLRQTFTVVPKGADGTISHNVVRYILHRFFVRRHGWFIRGLEPGSESVNSSASNGTQEWVPSYLLKFLEHMIGGRGVNLRELAVIAATFEDLIHREELGHLHKAYSTLWLKEDQPLESEKAFFVLETYMMIYLLGGNFTISSPQRATRLLELFGKKVASWDKTVMWLQRIYQKFTSGAHKTTFETNSKIVEEIGERYGIFNDDECVRLKSELMKMESQKPGRIRLADFYKRSLFGAWEFNEKIDYLRAAGLLDESEPKTPLVILPNYVASRPNCLLSSSFYAVCCRNQCEDLMDTLEREIGGPTARPSQIAKIVSKLSTDTIQGPRTLSKTLMQRLQEVARRNRDQVPLHGRLFAQWMHHAFPRECPYPNEAGTATPLTPDEWMQKMGQEESKASKEEMLSMISSDTCKFAASGVDCGGVRLQVNASKDEDLPWDSKEELLVIHEEPRRSLRHGVALNPLRDLVILISFLSLSWLASVIFLGKKSKICSTLLSWRSMSFSSVTAKADRCCV